MIKADADVKQRARFNPMRNPVIQPLRETAVTLHLYQSSEQVTPSEEICAFGEQHRIVLRTSRSTLLCSIVSEVERLVLNALANARVFAVRYLRLWRVKSIHLFRFAPEINC